MNVLDPVGELPGTCSRTTEIDPPCSHAIFYPSIAQPLLICSCFRRDPSRCLTCMNFSLSSRSGCAC